MLPFAQRCDLPMTVATSLPEQGQLVSIRSRQWIVHDERPVILDSPALKPVFGGLQHLLMIDSFEDDSPRLFAFEEPSSELRAVRTVTSEAAQTDKFVIPPNMLVPESSEFRSLFE